MAIAYEQKLGGWTFTANYRHGLDEGVEPMPGEKPPDKSDVRSITGQAQVGDRLLPSDEAHRRKDRPRFESHGNDQLRYPTLVASREEFPDTH